jgi:hypothetical protein
MANGESIASTGIGPNIDVWETDGTMNETDRIRVWSSYYRQKWRILFQMCQTSLVCRSH